MNIKMTYFQRLNLLMSDISDECEGNKDLQLLYLDHLLRSVKLELRVVTFLHQREESIAASLAAAIIDDEETGDA